ncbi:MAG: DUF885 domain-containing protein [Xanthomonadales bacterium]|nr:DUF885 domain-containing protein [Xanthomonadales bacterium]
MPYAVSMKAGLIAVLVLLASSFTTVVAADDSAAFKKIYEQEWAFRLKEFPTMASATGNDDYANKLGHVSEADQKRRFDYWSRVQQQLQALSCEQLSHEDCVNFRLYEKQISDFLADYVSKAYLIPFNSDWGFYMEWGRLPSDTDFNNAADYNNYLSRLEMMGPVMEEYIVLMRTGIELGITQPRVILEGRDEPIKAQLVKRVDASPFFAPFMEMPSSIPSPEQAALLARAQQVITESVIPAYQRLFEFFHQEYIPGARETLGAYQLPDGAAYYQAAIRRYATVDMSPQEIHDIGLSEVARIRAEMDVIIQQVEFAGDFPAFLEFLRTDAQFYARSAKELLAFASYYAKKIDGRLPILFGHLPRQPYGVAPVPDDIAPFYTGGRYVPAALESHRGGYYWVNTYQLESRPLYNIPALTLHEGAPGHHTQGALALEMRDQPDFRRNDYISAYGEGWGLYAEKLGVEMDIYETPYEHFGRLSYEMWRACRLVIDTGVHSMGWTRAQALDYLAANTALSVHEVTTEIDRYISWPGQALSYKLGEYTLWNLRREAESALGENFDVRAFHDFVLGLGSVTLDILQDEVRAWMASQLASQLASHSDEAA